jgi:hypothetical protein
MHRRRFLAGAAVLCGGLAGCAGQRDPTDAEGTSPGDTDETVPADGGSTTGAPGTDSSCEAPTAASTTQTSEDPSPATDTRTPGERTLALGETHEARDGTTVTVNDVRVRKLIRSTSVGSSTHIDVACLEDSQFAVADAEATDGDGNSVLDDARFAIEVDGTRYPRPDENWYWAFPPGSHERPGVPAFAVPIEDVSTAAVVWFPEDEEPVRWTVPAETVGSLGRAPRFSVCTLDVPDSISRDDSFEASFTVANAGDRDGAFVAEFGAGGVSDHGEAHVSVPAGSERNYTKRMDPNYPDGTEEIEVTLAWGCGRLDWTVSVTE